jgi:type II secretory pathway pseudopilin PulG
MTRGREGLTIVETLIAIAVIGVVFVVLAAIQVTSLRMTREAQEESQLLQDAVTEFEELRTVVLADFWNFYDSCPPPDGSGSCPEVDAAPGSYQILRVLEPDPAEPGEFVLVDGILQVTVAVSGHGRTLELSQFVSCLDATPSPTISNPYPCRPPPEGSP